MTNKTDKELIDEFRAKLDMSMIQLKENRNETFWKDHVLVDLLKQALSRKEEEMIELFRECLPDRRLDPWPMLKTEGKSTGFNCCLQEIKENLSNKGIEL